MIRQTDQSRPHSDIFISLLESMVLGVFAILCSPIMAANSVDIEMTSYGQHDTIWVDGWGNPVPATFDIFIENDVPLGGISLGFKIWTPDASCWEYRDVSDSFVLPVPEVNYLSVVPGSRLDPPNQAFDMTGLLVTERSMDGQNHDTILFGGISMMQSLPPGPREHMLSIHFKPKLTCLYHHICLDTTFVPPAGIFVFVDAGGHTFAPDILWEYGSKCWVVTNASRYVNGKVIVEPDTILARDAYSADPETLTVRVGFSDYEADEIDFPTVRIFDYNFSLTPLSMAIIDPITEYTKSALEMTFDLSDFILGYDHIFWGKTAVLVHVSGAFYDGRYFGMDTYDGLTIIGLTPGDANSDGIADIGDIVRIVDYLYRDGPELQPWETADVDASEAVDLADVAYLINYVFRDGPSPTHP